MMDLIVCSFLSEFSETVTTIYLLIHWFSLFYSQIWKKCKVGGRKLICFSSNTKSVLLVSKIRAVNFLHLTMACLSSSLLGWIRLLPGLFFCLPFNSNTYLYAILKLIYHCRCSEVKRELRSQLRLSDYLTTISDGRKKKLQEVKDRAEPVLTEADYLMDKLGGSSGSITDVSHVNQDLLAINAVTEKLQVLLVSPMTWQNTILNFNE